jgi:hypothetical protein
MRVVHIRRIRARMCYYDVDPLYAAQSLHLRVG